MIAMYDYMNELGLDPGFMTDESTCVECGRRGVGDRYVCEECVEFEKIIDEETPVEYDLRRQSPDVTHRPNPYWGGDSE